MVRRQNWFITAEHPVKMQGRIGLINDMYAESGNDAYKYAELATQEDFDKF